MSTEERLQVFRFNQNRWGAVLTKENRERKLTYVSAVAVNPTGDAKCGALLRCPAAHHWLIFTALIKRKTGLTLFVVYLETIMIITLTLTLVRGQGFACLKANTDESGFFNHASQLLLFSCWVSRRFKASVCILNTTLYILPPTHTDMSNVALFFFHPLLLISALISVSWSLSLSASFSSPLIIIIIISLSYFHTLFAFQLLILFNHFFLSLFFPPFSSYLLQKQWDPVTKWAKMRWSLVRVLY